MGVVECGRCKERLSCTDAAHGRRRLWHHALEEHSDDLLEQWPPGGMAYWAKDPQAAADEMEHFIQWTEADLRLLE